LPGRIVGQRLAVLGMGKLGSREMSATSDLDLIFVYDIPPGLEASDGRLPLAPIQYYTRLSAKIVTALTAHTNEGALYEVDMRLRPSGRAGPLASKTTPITIVRTHFIVDALPENAHRVCASAPSARRLLTTPAVRVPV